MARILVVDDSRFFRQRVRAVLDRAGHETLEAGDAQEAMRSIFTEAPDGVILDLILPDGEGLALLEELRQRDFSGPRIVLTADRQAMTRHLAETHGATCVLHEPIDADAVLAHFQEEALLA